MNKFLFHKLINLYNNKALCLNRTVHIFILISKPITLNFKTKIFYFNTLNCDMFWERLFFFMLSICMSIRLLNINISKEILRIRTHVNWTLSRKVNYVLYKRTCDISGTIYTSLRIFKEYVFISPSCNSVKNNINSNLFGHSI